VPDFERAFATPHGIDFGQLAALYGCGHRLLESASSLPASLDDALEEGGVQLIEARTNREANVELHRDLWTAVGAALT
jgi:2-succinyl-5-enolpyruvyl-6-hydroxy-3-cyclohexene-1-carboxylate synthase